MPAHLRPAHPSLRLLLFASPQVTGHAVAQPYYPQQQPMQMQPVMPQPYQQQYPQQYAQQQPVVMAQPYFPGQPVMAQAYTPPAKP